MKCCLCSFYHDELEPDIDPCHVKQTYTVVRYCTHPEYTPKRDITDLEAFSAPNWCPLTNGDQS